MMVCAGFLGFLSNTGFYMKLGSQIFQNMRLLTIEGDIRKPQNLAGAAVKFLSFTVVFRNYVFADIGIIERIILCSLNRPIFLLFIESELLLYSQQQTTTVVNFSFVQ